MRLTETLDKTISDFCRNHFTGSTENHCAHFVCHVLEVSCGYTCKMHTNGRHPGACLRVQELFEASPTVSLWSEPPRGMGLVFVTDKTNVDLESHTMRNVPKKHVGIFSGGHVYHYSNANDKVVRQTPDTFLERFQRVYGGNQALFFGSFPPSARIPEPEDGDQAAGPAAEPAQPFPVEPKPVIRAVPVSGGRSDYYAALPGVAEYYVARETAYQSRRGLSQPGNKVYGPRYTIDPFKAQYEAVAGMLGVIAAGESSGYFNRVNSYDRAAFTFGFFQLAAHTPRDNLILLFRRLAAGNSSFQTLFPDLKLLDGVLHRVVGGHYASLEKEYPRPGHPNEKNLKDFMTYLNSDSTKIDETELSTAARLVHLANTDRHANDLQVNVAAQISMRKLRNAYAVWYNLDGASDLICTAITDIHHQGRGSKSEVRAALAAGSKLEEKLDALCRIGETTYGPRCATLKQGLEKARNEGHLGISVFDKASGLFKPSDGWPA